ncbi:unnamed protein product [Arabidopsis halleri]
MCCCSFSSFHKALISIPIAIGGSPSTYHLLDSFLSSWINIFVDMLLVKWTL